MIIVWRGLGFLVPVPVLLALLIASQFPAHESLAGGIALLVSAAPMWFMGKRLNRESNVHSLYGIPMQYWAIVIAISGVLVIFGNR